MGHSLAQGIAFRRLGRDARLLRLAALFFVCLALAGCAPRGSMDFRLANLETRVMELEEQNRSQASQLDARLERLERYVVAEGVEKDRIRAAIAASRSDLNITTPRNEPNIASANIPAPSATSQRQSVTAQRQSKAAGELAVQVAPTGQSGDEEYVHPVSRPTARSAAPVADNAPDPNTPYDEPATPATVNVAAASNPPATQPAVARKPGSDDLPYAYTEAVRLTRSGNTEKGRQMLRAFIMEYPDSPLVPNAYYWLGETYYHDKRYAQAILTFREVTSRFPKDPKAAASMLKIGYSYEMLGDKDNARFYLNALVEDYPKSEPAKLARTALDERL